MVSWCCCFPEKCLLFPYLFLDLSHTGEQQQIRMGLGGRYTCPYCLKGTVKKNVVKLMSCQKPASKLRNLLINDHWLIAAWDKTWRSHTHAGQAHIFPYEQTRNMQIHTMHSHHTHRHRLRKPVTCCGQWAGMDLNSDDVSRRPRLQQTEARNQKGFMCLVNQSTNESVKLCRGNVS